MSEKIVLKKKNNFYYFQIDIKNINDFERIKYFKNLNFDLHIGNEQDICFCLFEFYISKEDKLKFDYKLYLNNTINNNIYKNFAENKEVHIRFIHKFKEGFLFFKRTKKLEIEKIFTFKDPFKLNI